MSQKACKNVADLRKMKIQSIRSSLMNKSIISKNSSQIQMKIKASIQKENNLSSSTICKNHNEITSIDFNDVNQAKLFDEKYQILEKVGEGTNGIVYKCQNIYTKQIYAVKSLMMDEQHIMELKQNFFAIRNLNHPNIVKYKAIYIDMRKRLCHIVMQYLDMPSLDKISIKNQEELKNIIFQLLQSTRYLHEKNLSHRDLKPENILYDSINKQIKIIDFGTSKQFLKRGIKIDMLTITGTLYYRAPEMFTGGGYNQKVDIWSIGILIYKLITGVTPFQSAYLSETIKRIVYQPVTFESHAWNQTEKAVQNLNRRMLNKDKNYRLSLEECMRDVWFYTLSFPILCDKTKSYWRFLYQIRNAQFRQKKAKDSLIMKNQTQSLNNSIKKIDGEDYHSIECPEQNDLIFLSKKRNIDEITKLKTKIPTPIE